MLKIISRWAIPINLMEKDVDREFLFFCFNFKGLIVCSMYHIIQHMFSRQMWFSLNWCIFLYRPIAGPSGPRQVDLPVQDSEKDDGEAYKMYARVVREGPPPKKYSVLPSDHSGGRLFDISPEERQRRDAADAAFIADMEADVIVLEAMHRPRRQQEARERTRVVDRAPKV
jgi:hypothetical protein